MSPQPPAKAADSALARYPEHRKLSKISTQSNACYDFVQWLSSQHGIFLAKYHARDSDRIVPANYSIAPLLAGAGDLDGARRELDRSALAALIAEELP